MVGRPKSFSEAAAVNAPIAAPVSLVAVVGGANVPIVGNNNSNDLAIDNYSSKEIHRTNPGDLRSSIDYKKSAVGGVRIDAISIERDEL